MATDNPSIQHYQRSPLTVANLILLVPLATFNRFAIMGPERVTRLHPNGLTCIVCTGNGAASDDWRGLAGTGGGVDDGFVKVCLPRRADGLTGTVGLNGAVGFDVASSSLATTTMACRR